MVSKRCATYYKNAMLSNSVIFITIFLACQEIIHGNPHYLVESTIYCGQSMWVPVPGTAGSRRSEYANKRRKEKKRSLSGFLSFSGS